MKKSFILVLSILLLAGIIFVGCENSTEIRTAYITEITGAGSKNYGVKIGYSEDKRLEGKGTDVQVKFEKVGKITIWKDGDKKIDYNIEDYDEWYSMTSIFSKDETTKFEKYEDALNKTYLFNYDGQMKVTFRVIVGQIEENSDKSGEILVGSQTISDNFTLKIK